MNVYYKELIFSDYKRAFNKEPSWKRIILRVIVNVNQGFTFMFWHRVGTCYRNKKPISIIRLISYIMHRKYSRRYSLYIPLGTIIGGGCSLSHAMCIVINEQTIIGNNVSIGQFVNIGSNHNNPATIGNHVYIGPHVSIVEDVKIGNNAIIGAGTVVTHNIPDNATSVGVPNRIINYNQKL